MKVAITGHTSGIGKAIADYFTARGDEVVGFSRSNGYVLPDAWQRIVNDSKDCDMFVNNARALGASDIAQSLILNALCNNWSGQEKRIINIGSISGRNPTTKHPVYTVQKAALKMMSSIFQSRQLKPRVFHIDFGRVLIPRTKDDPMARIPAEDIVKVIDFYLSFPHDILDITFRHKEERTTVV
jgi:NAD(P)-dependent dehydrogenase (short-subunit alcohol dehydrogenase family)